VLFGPESLCLVHCTKMLMQQTDELCQRHISTQVPEQLTCWASKTGPKMKQLVLFVPLKVRDKVLDTSEECL